MGNSGGAIIHFKIHETGLCSFLRLLRRGGRLLIFVLLFVFLALPLSATTYYVDNCVTTGNDANIGTSPSTPWLTIAHVNEHSFNPGDSILFQSTCEWREQLITPSGGSSGRPVTYGSYGTGAQPIISGFNVLSLTWTNLSGNLWSAKLASQPYVILLNGALGTRESSSSNVTAVDEWFWGSSTLYVYSTSSPSTAFTSPGIEASTRADAIEVTNNYVTVSNLELTGGNQTEHGTINIHGQTGITINGITTVNNAGYGIESWSSSSSAPNTNITIENNNVGWSGGSGIICGGYSSNTLIQGNNIHHNAWDKYDASSPRGISCGAVSNNNVSIQYNQVYDNGVGLATSAAAAGITCDTCGSGIVIQYNTSYGNNGWGIDIDADSNVTVAYNLSYNNGDAGIIVFSDANTTMSGMLIYNNTVYGTTVRGGYNAGISIQGPSAPGGCTNNRVINNISVGTSGGPNFVATGGCENPGTNGSGNVYTYNSFGTAASNFIEWGNTDYSTYSSWEAATGNCGRAGCSHSDETTPTFTNAVGNKFTLTSDSSAIDAGTDLGSAYQMALNAISSWPSAVVLVPQSNSGWEIGAFAFLQNSQKSLPAPPTGLSATVN